MGVPRKINHSQVLALYEQVGVIRETARQMGIHEQTVRDILKAARRQCQWCGQPLIWAQRICPTCLPKKRAIEREFAKKQQQAGLCVKCTEPLELPSRRFCTKHRIAMRDAMRTHRRKRMVNTTGTTLEAEKALRVRNAYGEGGAAAWERDKGCCVLCSRSYTEGAVYLHHIDQNRRNNVMTNFVCLCYKCHRLIHGFLEHPQLSKLLQWFHATYPEERLAQRLPRTPKKQPTASTQQPSFAFPPA
jgi:hypothetical protein